MRASDLYIGFVESIRMRASEPKNKFCGLTFVFDITRRNQVSEISRK